MKNFIHILGLAVLLLLVNNVDAQTSHSKSEVVPMQVLDLTKVSNENLIKWIVIKGKTSMPVIVEVSGANSEDLFVLVGKTMRGLQHGGLSNLVLIQTNDYPDSDPSDEKVWLYLKGKPFGVLKNPVGNAGTKALLQKKIMNMYDKAYGTNFYPYSD